MHNALDLLLRAVRICYR